MGNAVFISKKAFAQRFICCKGKKCFLLEKNEREHLKK